MGGKEEDGGSWTSENRDGGFGELFEGRKGEIANVIDNYMEAAQTRLEEKEKCGGRYKPKMKKKRGMSWGETRRAGNYTNADEKG